MKAWHVAVAGAVAGIALGYLYYEPTKGGLDLFGETLLTACGFGLLGLIFGLGGCLINWALSKIRCM